MEMVKCRVMEEVFDRFEKDGDFMNAVKSVMRGEKDPYTVSDEIILKKLNLS